MSRERNTVRKPVPQDWVKAYTLAEVLIVMSIFAILLGLGVPAFNSAIKNSDEVSAENQLRVGLAIARDAAVQRSGAEDTAAVFFYTPGGRTSIVPYVRVGTLRQPRSFGQNDLDLARDRGQAMEDREVFAPLSGAKSVQLPRGWMARAYAAPGTLDNRSQQYPTGWYTSNVLGRVYYNPETSGNWVFPETGFYPSVQRDPGTTAERAQSGRLRSTFMVRFRAGTGAIAVADQRLVIVIDPSPDTEFREREVPFNIRRGTVYAHRIDQAEDIADFVRRRLRGNIDVTAAVNQADEVARRQMFGVDVENPQNASSDSVLCRSITQVAIYREADLAQYLGARGVNRVTGCLYGEPPAGGQPQDIPKEPRIDTSLFATNPNLSDLSESISAWIEGRRPQAGPNAGVAPETTAKIYTFGTYLGQTIEYGDVDGGEGN
jgi:prepilin-type N-terminal cleavage/methylation domain-containing protein